MISVLKEYLFINYCGQKIGQFKGVDIRVSLLNVIVAQVVPFFSIAITFLYVSIGFRNFWVFALLNLLLVYAIRWYLKKHFFSKIPFPQLEEKFKKASKIRRVLNFFIAIFLTGGCVVVFAFSLYSLKYVV